MLRPESATGFIRRLREPPPPVVRASGVGHDFGTPDHPMPVLFDVDLRIGPGEMVILTGPSGSGKTTLLTLIGALRSVQTGTLRVMGKELQGLGEAERVAVRRGLGFIFQAHNLFASLTALQNVRLALELHGGRRRELDERAAEILGGLGLGDRLHHKPEALSGGQRQRVAVARALAARPPLILADEPTAALDAESGRLVIDLLQGLGREHGTATLLVTHDSRVLDAADRIVNMIDGRVVSNVHVNETIAICEFLLQVPIFAEHTPNSLAEIAGHMHTQRFPPGHQIFRQGDPGDYFYLVRDGSVRILDEDGGKELAVLGPGSFFGEVALIAEQPRNATAVTGAAAELYALDKANFQLALERGKSFRDQLLEIFLNRR